MRRPRPAASGLFFLFTVITIILQPPSTLASSVAPMTVQTLSDLSGQVIVGRVATVRSYWADHPRRIESEVRFEAVEYLKGRLAASTDAFTIIVPGGKVGQMQLQIADAPSFAAGEKWVLFLLPTYKTYPVAGLHQGAFRITTDAAGVERIYLPEGQPVLGVGADGFLKVNKAATSPASTRLVEADRVNVRSALTPETEAASALSFEDFHREIAPILQSSRDHRLTEPAGKRVPAVYTAVPFRTAAGEVVPATPSRNNAGHRGGLAEEATNVPPRKAVPVGPEARR